MGAQYHKPQRPGNTSAGGLGWCSGAAGEQGQPGGDLGQEVGADLEDTRYAMADGIQESSRLIAEGQASDNPTVFSGGDKFGNRGDEAIGSQGADLLEHTFFGGQIHDPADEEIGNILP